MTRPLVIRLDHPDQRDRARAMVGILPRHTIVLFLRPLVFGLLVAGAVLLGLAVVGFGDMAMTRHQSTWPETRHAAAARTVVDE